MAEIYKVGVVEHARVTPQEWARILDGFKRLREQLPERSRTEGGPYVDAKLEVKLIRQNARYIIFEGAGVRNSETLGGDSFILLGPEADLNNAGVLQTCRTFRMPYDLLVAATLIVADKEARGAYTLTSVGGEDDWEPALHFVRKVLGTGIDARSMAPNVPYRIPAGVDARGTENDEIRERVERFQKIRRERNATYWGSILRSPRPGWLSI